MAKPKTTPMTRRAQDWIERRRRAVERAPSIRIDRSEVTAISPGRGYQVVIEGFNLRPAHSPPAVTVGGVPLERMQFDPSGRVLKGVLRRKPGSQRVVVDFGFARAELKAPRGKVRSE